MEPASGIQKEKPHKRRIEYNGIVQKGEKKTANGAETKGLNIEATKTIKHLREDYFGKDRLGND